MITVREINSITDLESFYADSAESLHIIKIGAPWCGPCRTLSDTLMSLDLERIGDTLVGEVDIDVETAESIAVKYNVRSIPVILFVKNGEVVNKTIGTLPIDMIYEKIEEFK